MNRALARAALLLFLSLPGAAQVGTVTLKEGSLRLIRGTMVFQGAEGVRLRPGDMLETSDKGFAQLESAEGTVIALGPSGRMLVTSQASSGEFVLLSGWVKAESGSSHQTCRVTGPLLTTTSKDGAIVVHATADSSEAFFESAAGRVSPATGEASGFAAAKPGQFFSRRAGKKTAVGTRPDSTFIDNMPISFRDTLPSRIARFSKAVEPKPDHEVAYSDIEPWLKLAAWKKSFVERFRPRLKDREFRSQMEAHLGEHPEWDPVLHPEKYQPSGPAGATESSPSPRR
jgi:hypothetical protein